MPDLAISQYDIFNSCQFPQSHWASCMQFLSTYADLCAKPELKTISKTCGCININSSCIHLLNELLTLKVISSHDGFRVFCPILAYMGNSFINTIHNFDSYNHI